MLMGAYVLVFILKHLPKLLLISKERQGRNGGPVFIRCLKLKLDLQSLPLKKGGMLK